VEHGGAEEQKKGGWGQKIGRVCHDKLTSQQQLFVSGKAKGGQGHMSLRALSN